MSSRLKPTLTLLVLTLLFVTAFSIVGAQDTATTGHIITAGTTVNGTLDTQNITQVYAFTASADETVTVTASNAANVRLAVVLTDSAGTSIAQAIATGTQTNATLSAVEIQNGGTYYITVLSADGALASGSVNFQLNLESSAVTGGATFTPPGQLLTTTGLQINLSWNSNVNLDLEVRDPIGGSLRFATPTVDSGGTFGTNANSVCNALSETPAEQASWPAGAIPTGSYELLVYYQPLTDCPTTDPANFTLGATIDGTAVTPFEGTLQPNEVYIASFVVKADGTTTVGLNGIKSDTPTVPSLTSATTTTLARDVASTGAITSAAPFAVYTFAGQANDIVSIAMASQSGSLDTLLILLDPNGNILASNDDQADGVTNSEIANTALILGGNYTVIATRYGQNIGGTEGEYTLTLTGAVSNTGGDATLTSSVPNLPDLPSGSVEVILQWSTNADIQLLVRDPQGDTIFNDKPTLPSGATLASNGNVNCTTTSTSPISYIYWPENRLPAAGPYEIEVQYRNNCGDTSPVTFNLYVLANGQQVLAKTQGLLQDERFVTSYNIGVDGQVTAGEGGIFGTTKRPDAATLSYSPEIENAQILTNNQTITGSLRLTQKFSVYVFDATAGQTVTIGMNRLNGTIDPVLFLMSPSGVQITQNDDATGGTNTDSLISGFTLPEDGRYIIIATHFGGPFGVTAGDYNLTIRLT